MAAGTFEELTIFFENAYDNRISDYPLMGNVYKILMLAAAYLFMVKYAGKKYMSNREPYKLERIMQFYNALQVILNTILTIQILSLIFNENADYDFVNCPIPDFNHTEHGYKFLNLVYFYYLLKVLDLMDTIFIILKKNYRQASVLHIYHHTIMVVAMYYHTQYYAGGAYMIPFMLNAFVHIVMYGYFFLLTIRPELKKSLWWKKHITHVQMIQFCINLIFFTRIALNKNCEYSTFWAWFGFSQNFIFLILFSNFYIRNYLIVNKTNKEKLK